ncbi:hypothetical protein [Pseudanabaena sp. UWO310]|uniref:hypothetical protein n=1 Tax=Pseudanabaena sp. UWO310 TaxID=2480795 RepID=UPI00115C1169|nr:hypothetical protein [Pseudanabaena sp. UWO310]TYQ30739.1 hypothetical protein PseudUWO310_07355 [Pseudanabaena sp. UWO310]
MNSPEPNSADLSADTNAERNPIATASIAEMERSPRQNLGSFLDRLYGTLFLPQATFEELKANPTFEQALIVIALVNSLETLRLERFTIFKMFGSMVSAAIGWLFFTFLLQQLASVFQKKVEMKVLLTLTGFASLPWLFMAPALSLPIQSRTNAAIAVIIWFIIWQVWSASVVLEIKIWKTLTIFPLAIAGGVVALIWLGNAFKLIFSISF